jgi:hypothetical protein
LPTDRSRYVSGKGDDGNQVIADKFHLFLQTALTRKRKRAVPVDSPSEFLGVCRLSNVHRFGRPRASCSSIIRMRNRPVKIRTISKKLIANILQLLFLMTMEPTVAATPDLEQV